MCIRDSYKHVYRGQGRYSRVYDSDSNERDYFFVCEEAIDTYNDVGSMDEARRN